MVSGSILKQTAIHLNGHVQHTSINNNKAIKFHLNY